MKKLLLMFILISMSFFISAQEDVKYNQYFIGGSFNFSIQNNYIPSTQALLVLPPNVIVSNSFSDSKYTTFSFSPSFGKELSNKLFVGVNAGYGYSQSKTTRTNFIIETADTIKIKSNTNQFNIGIFSRHIINPANALQFYFQPYINYYFTNEKLYVDTDVNSNDDVKYLSVGSGCGLLYQLNRKMRATLRTGGLAYTTGKSKEKLTNKTNDFSHFGLNFSLSSIYIGFEYRL